MNNFIKFTCKKDPPINKKQDLISNNSYFDYFLKQKKNKIFSFCEDMDNAEKELEKYVKTIKDVSKKIKIGINNLNKILLIGQIQSGKTDFVLGIISKLFDGKTNIIVWLTNSMSKLKDQNFDRFEKCNFSNIKMINNIKQAKKAIIEKNQKCVLFLLKQKNNLESLNDFINNNQNNITNLTIIDDEADVASFNNRNLEEDTLIYEKLGGTIKNTYKYGCTYLTVTATPFAHILYDKIDFLKPKYAFYLEPGESYFGVDNFIDLFHETKYIHLIEQDDEEIANNIFYSLLQYIIICAKFLIKNNFEMKNLPRLLLNYERKTDEHELTNDKVITFINRIKSDKEFFMNKLFKEFKDVSIVENVKQNDDLIFETIYNDVLDKIHTHIINSKSNSSKVVLDEHSNSEFQIIIGSDKLSRGITIVDLYVSFYARFSNFRNNADTVMQAARWLGYRKKHIDLVRVVTTHQIFSFFVALNEIYSNLIPKVKEINFNDNTFDINYLEFDSFTEKFYGTRDAVVEQHIQRGAKKYYNNFIYYKNKFLNSDFVKLNDFMYNNFINLYKNDVDENNNPIIVFKNINEFNKKFLQIDNIDEIKNVYLNLFNIDGYNFEKIINLNHPIKIRIYRNQVSDNFTLNYNKKRILLYSEAMNHYSFGGSNFIKNNKDEILIDIVAFDVYTSDKTIGDKIVRSILSLPKNSITKSGIFSY